MPKEQSGFSRSDGTGLKIVLVLVVLRAVLITVMRVAAVNVESSVPSDQMNLVGNISMPSFPPATRQLAMDGGSRDLCLRVHGGCS